MYQQRTSRVRGVVQNAVPRLIPGLEWRITSIAESAVTIALAGPSLPLVITGIPQVAAGPDGVLPINCTVSGANVTLDYPSELDISWLLTWPNQDPAIRTRTGQYVSGWTQGKVVPIVLVHWQVVANGGLSATIQPTDDMGPWLIINPGDWVSQPSGTPSNGVMVGSEDIVFNFPADVTADTQLNFEGPDADTISITGARFATGPQPYPGSSLQRTKVLEKMRSKAKRKSGRKGG